MFNAGDTAVNMQTRALALWILHSSKKEQQKNKHTNEGLVIIMIKPMKKWGTAVEITRRCWGATLDK